MGLKQINSSFKGQKYLKIGVKTHPSMAINHAFAVQVSNLKNVVLKDKSVELNFKEISQEKIID